MIWSLLRPFAPFLAAAAILVGLWLWHTSAVSSADEAGYSRCSAEWNESDRVSNEVGRAQTKLLARAAIKETETLHARLQKAEAISSARAAELGRRIAVADGLQQRLDASATAAESRAASAPAGSDARQLASCERLVGEAGRMASEIDRVAEEYRAALARWEERLSSMRRWAMIVEFANEAP